MFAGLVLCVVVSPPCSRFVKPFGMRRVLLLALAPLTFSVDAGLPYRAAQAALLHSSTRLLPARATQLSAARLAT